jgi:hypothetical protein
MKSPKRPKTQFDQMKIFSFPFRPHPNAFVVIVIIARRSDDETIKIQSQQRGRENVADAIDSRVVMGNAKISRPVPASN